MGRHDTWSGPLRLDPGHGNWPGKFPAVHRWPYDYAKGDRDFIPQIEPTERMGT